MRVTQRGIRQLPVALLSGFVLLLLVQIAHHHFFQTTIIGDYRRLTEPKPVDFYRSLSMGSDNLVSYLLLLSLQLHDNQRGRHVNYVRLDYQVLQTWLRTIYRLNPRSDYPAFLASRVYSQVSDRQKLRAMVLLIEEFFELDPQQHWRRMTEASLLAKHQLDDLPLALRLATKIAELPESIDLPYWARDMQLVLLDELGHLESALMLISSMLQSGRIKDPDELRFLQSRLLKIQQAMLKNEQKR